VSWRAGTYSGVPEILPPCPLALPFPGTLPPVAPGPPGAATSLTVSAAVPRQSGDWVALLLEAAAEFERGECYERSLPELSIRGGAARERRRPVRPLPRRTARKCRAVGSGLSEWHTSCVVGGLFGSGFFSFEIARL